MRRPLAPLWLAQPSRFAAVSRRTAHWLVAGVAALLVASLLALHIPEARGPASAGDQTDLMLYDAIVSGLRHGGSYYAVVADALRAGDYPLRPFVTFRLPTLAVIQALLPPIGVSVLLWTLVAAVMVAWYGRLRPAFRTAGARLAAFVLLAAGLLAFVQAELAPFHEIWAGLFIALSLALRRPGRWVEAAAFGLAAVLIRETAALYILVMAALAAIEGERREAGGWLLVLAILAVVVALHAHAVAEVVRPLDPRSPGWAGMLGFGYFVRTICVSTALGLAPLWIGAPLVVLALVGWAGWRDPLALRGLATWCAYALLLGLFGRVDTFYWGLLVAPAILVGLAAAPDSLRDLVAAALDSRRITVRRVAR